jgi:hypothetical protein
MALQLAQQTAFDIQRPRVCAFRAQQLIVAHAHFVHRFSIDVDFIRSQELFETDSLTYTAAASLNA